MTVIGLHATHRIGLAFTPSRRRVACIAAQEPAGSPGTDAEPVSDPAYTTWVTPRFTRQPDLQQVLDSQDPNASDACVGGYRGRVTC